MKKDFFNKKIPIRSIAIVFSLLLIATLIGYIFKLFNFSEVNVVILYVLVVLLVSYFTETYIYMVLLLRYFRFLPLTGFLQIHISHSK